MRLIFFIWIILLGLLALLYFLSIQLGEIELFRSLIYKLGGSALSSFLLKMGCSSSLAFGMVLIVKAVLTAEVAPNMVLPDGTEAGASGATYKEDTEEIDILMESSWETEDTGSSVNQPAAGPVPPGNAVASTEEAASPARQDPFPYQPDEVIGGDSVLSIQRRLLAKDVFPPAEIIDRARIEAEDLFEVKVNIIRRMTPLDPEGDWLGRGARALDNPRTATGEESLERLYRLLEDLNQGGVESDAFRSLREKVFPKREDLDENSGT